MLRFVILEHDHPFLHWDLMLEAGESLRAWRLHGEPVVGETVVTEPLPDHRLAYLDYEGPVSGNRGTVQRWDAGEYRLVEDAAARVMVELRGVRLSGTAVISSGPDGCQFAFTASTV
jgi:DNA polymerase Ligase (LigD)